MNKREYEEIDGGSVEKDGVRNDTTETGQF